MCYVLSMALRFDNIHTSMTPKRGKDGFMYAPAKLSKAGIFTYKDTAGNEYREFRSPEEVVRADSVESLKGVPVSIGHKAVLNKDNVSAYGVGHVSDVLDTDGNSVSGGIHIQRADGVDAVDSGITELSPAYTCDIVNEAGSWKGHRYDRKQTNIMYNHIALVPKGKGRQGVDVALRLDSDSAIITPEKEGIEMDNIEVTIRLDGKDFQVTVPKAMAQQIMEASTKNEAYRNDSTELETETQTVKAELKTAKEALQKAEDQLTEDKLRERFDIRYKLLEKSRQMVKDLDYADKSNREIQMCVLAERGHEVRADSSDEYIQGLFDGLTVEPAQTPAVKTPAVKREDSAGKNVEEEKLDPRTKMLSSLEDAWQSK